MIIFPDTSGYDCRRPVGNTFVYDRPMDYSKQVGATFAFIKCSEYVEDPGFAIQWDAARKAGLILGAWHYFHPSANAILQAQLQTKLLKKVGLNWGGNPKNSDHIQLDLEVTDGLPMLSVAKSAASWYYEIRKVFPFYEIDIYTGWWFWTELLSTGFNMDWAKDTSLWLPAYPLDPTPRTINPPPPFNLAQIQDLASKAFTQYALKDLAPWGQPSFRQITAYADTRFVPGHPAIKKVADINVVNPNYFGSSAPNIPIPTPTSLPAPSTATQTPTSTKYTVIYQRVNIRSKPDGNSQWVRYAVLNEIVYVSKIENGWAQLTDGTYVFAGYIKVV